MNRRDLLAGLGLLALLPACASTRGENADLAAIAATFYDARSGARLSRRQLLQRMAPAPIVLLGEVHDNRDHHRVRAGLLLEWVRRQPSRPAAIVFEHLDREHNEALRLAQGEPPQRGRDRNHGEGPSLLELLDAAGFDREGWGWPAHLPLFEAAQASGARWIAANLSRASARRLSREPDAAVEPVLQAMLESSRWSADAQQSLSQALLQGHCNAIPASAVESIARVQRLRDAALALPLLDASERRSLLLAGNGHVRRDHGVPLYLGAFEKEALVVGFEELDGGTPAGGTADLASIVGAARALDFARGYDCVCLTAGAAREDPCAELKGLPQGGAVTP
jgi:uncharacterized iron-regulated protein